MRTISRSIVSVTVLALLSACAGTPMGPRVQVMPGPNKPFEVFQQDQAICKQYATDQVNGQAENANERAVGTALLGGAVGAGVGAVVGGGRGAGVGAATGGAVGTAVGASNSQHAQGGIQQQYDNAYSACMYSKGNQVAQPMVVQPTVIYAPPPQPVYVVPAAPVYAAPPAPVYAPPPGAAIPPPPPGQ